MAAFEFCKVFRTLGMHQIKIKIFHAAPRKLVFKKRPDLLFLFKEKRRQFIGKDIAVPGMPAGQAAF